MLGVAALMCISESNHTLLPALSVSLVCRRNLVCKQPILGRLIDYALLRLPRQLLQKTKALLPKVPLKLPREERHLRDSLISGFFELLCQAEAIGRHRTPRRREPK